MKTEKIVHIAMDCCFEEGFRKLKQPLILFQNDCSEVNLNQIDKDCDKNWAYSSRTFLYNFEFKKRCSNAHSLKNIVILKNLLQLARTKSNRGLGIKELSKRELFRDEKFNWTKVGVGRGLIHDTLRDCLPSGHYDRYHWKPVYNIPTWLHEAHSPAYKSFPLMPIYVYLHDVYNYFNLQEFKLPNKHTWHVRLI